MDNINQGRKKILVFVEREGQEITSITFELLAAGRKLVDDSEGVLCAVVIGHETAEVSQEIANFVEEVYSLDHIEFTHFQAEIYANALEQLFRNINPDIILMAHTLNGLDLAPRLAYKLGTEVIPDCISLNIKPETGHLHCVKPVYGAKLIAELEPNKKPFMVMIRSKAIEPTGPRPGRGEIIHFTPIVDKSLAKVELVETIKEESISLDKADAIVSGGRGIKTDEGVEGLEQLKELIRVLGKRFSKVELGASRPLVDAGLVSSSRQVGLTGEKVAPELYIAVGISGSLQHLTGMLGSKKIIAINNNSKAPIFEVAHYGIVGNYQDVLPSLIRKLEELL